MIKEDILTLIKEDKWMMEVLSVAESENLNDWVIGAGFVRNKVWDYLSDTENSSPESDVDLVYFDLSDVREETEKECEVRLNEKLEANWSVKNQARMHIVNKEDQYSSTEEAISRWPETVTAIGVTLKNGELELVAPYGIEDLVNFVVRPTPSFQNKLEVVRGRVSKKKWVERWPKIKLFTNAKMV
jgi:hypothetical protein